MRIKNYHYSRSGEKREDLLLKRISVGVALFALVFTGYALLHCESARRNTTSGPRAVFPAGAAIARSQSAPP
jgi:hypothetical protein